SDRASNPNQVSPEAPALGRRSAPPKTTGPLLPMRIIGVKALPSQPPAGPAAVRRSSQPVARRSVPAEGVTASEHAAVTPRVTDELAENNPAPSVPPPKPSPPPAADLRRDSSPSKLQGIEQLDLRPPPLPPTPSGLFTPEPHSPNPSSEDAAAGRPSPPERSRSSVPSRDSTSLRPNASHRHSAPSGQSAPSGHSAPSG